MVMVLVASFSQVWRVRGYSFLLQPHVTKIDNIWMLFLRSKGLWYILNDTTWVLRDSSSMFYLGHYDSDRDGREELYFYALRNGPDTFYIFEADSLGNFDLTRDKAVYVDIASGSNMMMPGPPTCYFGDADRDGYRDVICTPYAYDSSVVGCELCPWAVMFESVGDNLWERKVLTSDAPRYPAPTMIDSDRDGKPEFVGSGVIYEVVGDDSVEEVARFNLPRASYALMVNDADGDGRPEIVLYGFGGTSGILYFHVYILEADTNNSWNVVKHMIIDSSGAVWMGSGNSGDIDGDGRPELLMGGFGRVRVLKAVGDDDYEEIGVLNGSISDVSVSNVYDMDEDGLMEFAVSYYYGSGVGTTVGYEYAPLSVGERGDRPISSAVIGREFVEVKHVGVVRVYDASGREVKRAEVEGEGKVYVSDLPSGVYFLRLGRKTIKFIRR